MSVAKELLELIVCPVTHGRLTVAEEPQKKEVLAGLLSGRLKPRTEPDFDLEEITDFLVTEGGDHAYPVVREIPNLLPTARISLKTS